MSFAGARCPDASNVPGRLTDLVSLSTEHASGLWAEVTAASAGADTRLWDYLPYGPFEDAASFADWIADRADSTDPRFYAIVARATGAPAGVLALMRCEPEHGTIEIGHVWLGPSLQRTIAATDAFYAAARYAFNALGHRRLEWKCDARNSRSRSAAERLGYEYEGTFRQHMFVKGRNRDTAWFSILDHEWPALDAAFECWVAAANFDTAGRQRVSLSDLRGS